MPMWIVTFPINFVLLKPDGHLLFSILNRVLSEGDIFFEAIFETMASEEKSPP